MKIPTNLFNPFRIPADPVYDEPRDTTTILEDTDMATRQVLVDDLTGTNDDVQLVSFTMSGMTYTLDLGVASRTRLAAALQPFIDHARANKAARTVHRKRSPGEGRNSDVAELRHWARANGFTIGDRGRIPANIREAYDARQQPQSA